MADGLFLVVIIVTVGAFAAAWWAAMWLLLRAWRRWRDDEIPRDSRWEIYREGDE